MNPPVSASQFANLLPAPPDVSAAWNTFVLQRLTAPLHLQTTLPIMFSGCTSPERTVCGTSSAVE